MELTSHVARSEQPAPMSLRVDPDLQDLVSALAKRLKVKKHAIAVAALRLGLRAIEKDPSAFIVAQREANEAELAALEAKLKK